MRTLPILCPYPGDFCEKQLSAALIEIGLFCTVERIRYAEVQASPIPGHLFKPTGIRLFVKGFSAGKSAASK